MEALTKLEYLVRPLKRTDPFRHLLIFFFASYITHSGEAWNNPWETIALMLLGVLFAWKSSRGTAVLLLLTKMTYQLGSLPDLANHSNLHFLLSGIFLVFCLWPPEDKDGSDSEVRLAILKPLLISVLAVVYFFTGFHKFNGGFFTPDYSCIDDFVGRFGEHLRLPYFDHPAWVTIGLAIIVLFWELIGSFFLLFQRLQRFMVFESIFFHLSLSLIGFVDFSSLALGLLLFILPDRWWREGRLLGIRRLGPVCLHPGEWYFGWILVYAGMSYVMLSSGTGFLKLGQGIIWCLGASILLLPAAKELIAGKGLVAGKSHAQAGEPVGVSLKPLLKKPALLIVPLALFLFGMSPYFGLRTAGVFSMFSNLKTEGESSNHFLLADNPLKIFPYQDDRLTLIYIDLDESIKGIDTRSSINRIEFCRQMAKLRRSGVRRVRGSLEYQGMHFRFIDVLTWKGCDDIPYFLLRTQDFRPIPTKGEIPCLW